MTYELHFENHPEPVEIATGFGFKAPKAWGRMVRANDVPTDDCCPEMEVNPLAEIDQRIQKEEFKLDELVASSEIAELEKSIGQLDIRALVSSGIDRRAMLASQRFLKVQRLREVRAKNQTQIEHQQVRIASLRMIRSEREKGLSND